MALPDLNLLKQLFFRVQTSGVNQRIKNLAGLGGDTKVVDYVDVDVPANAIGLGSVAQGAALSLLGVAGNAAATLASIAFSADGHLLKRSGTAIVSGLIDAANLSVGAVTFAKRSELWRKFDVSGTGITNLANATLTTTGSKGTWAAVNGSNQQAVPEAGDYDIDFQVQLTSASVSNPQGCIWSIYVNGSSVIEVGRGWRYSATAANPFGAVGSQRVTLASGDLVSFRPSATVDISAGVGWARITKVSE